MFSRTLIAIRANILKLYSKKYLGIVVLFLLFVLVFPLSVFAVGDIEKWMYIKLIGPGLVLLIEFFGKLLIFLIGAMGQLAHYNNFIHSQVVINGWVIVRDVFNSFFIVILLVVAFSTIFQYQQYNYKTVLPSLLKMAILINFSRTIVGLSIDFAQVIMLTFVNSLDEIFNGGIITALGMGKIVSLAKESSGTVFGTREIILALMLSLLLMTIVLFTILWMFAIIAIRIVMLWLLTVLSPAAFFLFSFPGGKAHAGKWLKEFTNQLMVGPLLMFFLWLSLASYAVSSVDVNSMYEKEFSSLKGSSKQESFSFVSKIGNYYALVNTIMSIVLLLAGIKITQDIGAYGANAAASKIKSGMMKAPGRIFRAHGQTYRGVKTGLKKGLSLGIGAGKVGYKGVDVVRSVGRSFVQGGPKQFSVDVTRKMLGGIKKPFRGLMAVEDQKSQEKVQKKLQEINGVSAGKEETVNGMKNNILSQEDRAAYAMRGMKEGYLSNDEIEYANKQIFNKGMLGGGNVAEQTRAEWNSLANKDHAIVNMRAQGASDHDIARAEKRGEIDLTRNAEGMTPQLMKALEDVKGKKDAMKTLESIAKSSEANLQIIAGALTNSMGDSELLGKKVDGSADDTHLRNMHAKLTGRPDLSFREVKKDNGKIARDESGNVQFGETNPEMTRNFMANAKSSDLMNLKGKSLENKTVQGTIGYAPAQNMIAADRSGNATPGMMDLYVSKQEEIKDISKKTVLPKVNTEIKKAHKNIQKKEFTVTSLANNLQRKQEKIPWDKHTELATEVVKAQKALKTERDKLDKLHAEVASVRAENKKINRQNQQIKRNKKILKKYDQV